MRVRITGHHLKITSPLKSYIEAKIARIERTADRLQSVEFVLEKEAYQVLAEIHVRDGSIGVTAKHRDPDPKKAVDFAMDKLEAQLRKRISKLRGNKKDVTAPNRNAKKADLTGSDAGLDARPVGRVAAQRAPRGRKAIPARASSPGKIASVNGNGRNLPLTLDKFNIHVFASGRHDVGRMSVEEAAEELFFKDENFLCFINLDSGTMNVVYRRKDGNFAVIEPESAST